MQVLFFVIQGLGVLATGRAAVSGNWRSLAVFCTLVFNIGTAAFFFLSLDNVLAIYARR
jgi:hypothetical protein